MNEHPALDIDAWNAAIPDKEVWIADGYNVKVTVRDGHLNIEDGVPGRKRERKLARVPRSVKRVIILARVGYISLEALRWLADTNTQVTHISGEKVTMSSGSRQGTYALIHAQTKNRKDIARFLAAAKVREQVMTLRSEFGLTSSDLVCSQMNEMADTIEESYNHPVNFIRSIEGLAAKLYWGQWKPVAVNWSPSDLVKVPEHWRSYPGRPSLRFDWETNRNATDPVNAMLNYVYKVLESETLLACQAYEMHPDLGVLHVHGTDRHAFVLDLMEPVRPFCDRLVLRYLKHRQYFDRRWCHEERDGRVVLDPPLTHRLAGWSLDVFASVMEYARKVREMYLDE